ncbi:MAG: helix-turn-helix domain-containing protein [Planctomycetes bacterium]|nr:helix-turn-helix domain-containing protein [Planctomycetota bacterium]
MPLADALPHAPAPLLRARDVAERLGVDAKTVRRWGRDGTLPAPLHIGGVNRWRTEAIDAWLASQEKGA